MGLKIIEQGIKEDSGVVLPKMTGIKMVKLVLVTSFLQSMKKM